MTQFAGYVLPGAVFVAFGLKWTLDASTSNLENLLYGDSTVRTDKKKKRRGGRCRNCCSLEGLPAEGIVKLVVTAIGIAASIAAAYPSGLGELQHVGDILYATVYLFFAISGLVDVLTFYCPHAIPYGLNHFSLAMAFTIEGLMFCLHLRHQAFMEQHVHILLVCSIFACAAVSLIEIVMPYSLLIKFARAFSSLVHGSWYIQSGFILYKPSRVSPQWNSSQDYNNALVWISLKFAWHAAGSFICLLVIILIARRRKPLLTTLSRPDENIEVFESPPSHDRAGSCSSPAIASTTTAAALAAAHLQQCNFCSSHHTLKSA